MSFSPILPAGALIALAVVLVAIRMLALYRMLLRTGTGRYRRVVARWATLTAAGLLLVLAAARPGLAHNDPQRPAANKPAAAANANVFFVVDRSVDGRVTDHAGATSRMSGIRADIAALIDQYPRARFTLIGYAAKAQLDWPLSDEVWGLKPFVNGLSPYTEVPPDAMFRVNAAAANTLLRTKLAEATAHYRDSKNLVFYFGEGAGGSRAPQDGFDVPHDAIAGGAVLGYGTVAGGPIPRAYTNGTLTYMWDNQTNRAAHSGLNEDALKAIAAQLGVPYFHRDNSPITPVLPAVELSASPHGDTALVTSITVQRSELYWVFTALAAALTLVEIAFTLREFRRTAYQHRPRKARR